MREGGRERECVCVLGWSNILMMGAIYPLDVFEQIRNHWFKAQHSRTHSHTLSPSFFPSIVRSKHVALCIASSVSIESVCDPILPLYVGFIDQSMFQFGLRGLKMTLCVYLYIQPTHFMKVRFPWMSPGHCVHDPSPYPTSTCGSKPVGQVSGHMAIMYMWISVYIPLALFP